MKIVAFRRDLQFCSSKFSFEVIFILKIIDTLFRSEEYKLRSG
jgi:hypothetical protein